MATHDYVIANASGAAVRTDLNNSLAAIVTNNSNATAPATTYPYQWWADTTANQLKLRNSDNNAWIVIRELDGTMSSVTLKNSTEEDTDGGRESSLTFEGLQSGGEVSTLAQLEASHDGTADDEKGKLVISTNDGSDGASPTAALTISSDQTVAVADNLTVNGNQYPTAGALSSRNKLINGAMVHDQRNAGTAVTHTGSANLYVLDRWACNSTGTPQFSVQRVADGPTGFTYSSKLTTTTSGTPAANDSSYYIQYIEGNNVADLEFGTAGAKTVTVSFYVKSSLTGTFGGALKNGATNRAYPFSYTISSASTWEYKTVTIAGDTSGTWATDNTIGMGLAFDTGSGSNNKGTAGAWAATADLGVTSGVNLVETASATWQITGVQLEIGTKATPFEHRNYGDELARCQRYYETSGGTGGDAVLLARPDTADAGADSVIYCVQKSKVPTVVLTNKNNTATVANSTTNGIGVVFSGNVAYAECGYTADAEL